MTENLELSKQEIKYIKGIAILFMVILHLFCRKDIADYYDVILTVNNTPFIYYIALIGGACVPMYCFCSGYGLYISYQKAASYAKNNLKRVIKLLINFWIVVVATCAVGILLGMSDEIPGDIWRFLKCVFLLQNQYCGAWWFMQTYVLLVISSPIIFKMINKFNSFVLLSISLAFYFVAYIQRIKVIINSDNEIIMGIITAIALYGTSQLSFVVGGLLYKHRIISKLRALLSDRKYKYFLILAGFIFTFAVHSFIETMFIDPFIAIIIICLWSLIDINKIGEKILDFFGTHSTNIWLTHMLFYMVFAEDFIFMSRIPIVIFITLILCSVAASYVIITLQKLIDSICLSKLKLFD